VTRTRTTTIRTAAKTRVRTVKGMESQSMEIRAARADRTEETICGKDWEMA